MTEAHGTKEKILEVAQELFAQKGFRNTSVREIANAADVNVALINYHFKSKDKLFWSVYLHSKEILNIQVNELVNNCTSVEDLMKKIFVFLHESSRHLRNTFMLMLSEDTPPANEEITTAVLNNSEFGPPGGEAILKKLTDEVGEGVPFEKRVWAVRTLMMNNFIWTLMMTGSHCQTFFSDRPEFQLENRLESISEHVRAIVNHLKSEK